MYRRFQLSAAVCQLVEVEFRGRWINDAVPARYRRRLDERHVFVAAQEETLSRHSTYEEARRQKWACHFSADQRLLRSMDHPFIFIQELLQHRRKFFPYDPITESKKIFSLQFISHSAHPPCPAVHHPDPEYRVTGTLQLVFSQLRKQQGWKHEDGSVRSFDGQLVDCHHRVQRRKLSVGRRNAVTDALLLHGGHLFLLWMRLA